MSGSVWLTDHFTKATSRTACEGRYFQFDAIAYAHGQLCGIISSLDSISHFTGLIFDDDDDDDDSVCLSQVFTF